MLLLLLLDALGEVGKVISIHGSDDSKFVSGFPVTCTIFATVFQ